MNALKLRFSLGSWLILGVFAASLPGSVRADRDLSATLKEEWVQVERMRRRSLQTVDPTNRYSGNQKARRLGEALFYDTRLSGNGAVSCASCHIADRAFADDLPLSVGVDRTKRHTPSIQGVSEFEWFSWDGKADSIWSQALKVIEDPAEMGGNRKEILSLIKTDSIYLAQIDQILSEVIAPNASFTTLSESDGDFAFSIVGKIISAYVGSLEHSDSRFDKFVDGVRDGRVSVREAGLNEDELRGLALFVGKANCVLCHRGSQLSDHHFHNIGLSPRRSETGIDQGRLLALQRLARAEFSSASRFSDAPAVGRLRIDSAVGGHPMWGAFKTPSLRNVAITAPYMRDGRYSNLREVVQFYSTLDGLQTGHHAQGVLQPLNLNDKEIQQIIAFLRTLTEITKDP